VVETAERGRKKKPKRAAKNYLLTSNQQAELKCGRHTLSSMSNRKPGNMFARRGEKEGGESKRAIKKTSTPNKKLNKQKKKNEKREKRKRGKSFEALGSSKHKCSKKTGKH